MAVDGETVVAADGETQVLAADGETQALAVAAVAVDGETVIAADGEIPTTPGWVSAVMAVIVVRPQLAEGG